MALLFIPHGTLKRALSWRYSGNSAQQSPSVAPETCLKPELPDNHQRRLPPTCQGQFCSQGPSTHPPLRLQGQQTRPKGGTAGILLAAEDIEEHEETTQQKWPWRHRS